MANIEAAKEYLTINIRINSDRTNIESVRRFTNYLTHEKGWTSNPSFHIAPVKRYNANCDVEIDDCFADAEFSQIDMEMVNGFFGSHRDEMRRTLFPKIKGNYCGAVYRGSHVVDPNGDLYACWDQIGDKERRIGNVIQKNPMNAEYIKWLLYEPSGECLKCEKLPICMGGCPYQFFASGKPVCDVITYNFKERLKLAYQDHMERKSKAVNE